MQAIILAAGMGNRLGKYTKNNTKCMLPINGKTLGERALDALDEAGIRKCIFVVGYKKENVMSFLGNKYKNVEIIYVSNDIYDKTNNIYSLYLAKDYLLQDDTLLLESDLIFEDRLISDMLADPNPTIAAVAKFESWMDGTVVQISENKEIAAFIPKKLFTFDEKHTYYKTVNVYKFSRNFSQNTYIPFLEAYSRTMGNNEYYEQVLRVIATLDKSELKAFILNGQKWYEIDDIQDKNIAETIFCDSPKEKLKRIQSAYGGYWRYPSLLDFCYLVNPYFPSLQMSSELKAYFSELLASYPSGQNTQNLLGAKLYNIEETQVLIGNGAAELIRAVAAVIKGKIGITYPTFNEYAESFLSANSNVNIKNEIIQFIPENFSYSANDLITFSKKCDCLLLINPDNPSGNFIPHDDVIKLAASLKKDGKKLILDESFIDFVDIEKNPSLLCQEILSKYPNVIIIKSLSKSYGVPGIRLGALACGDEELIKQIRKNLSIWNINSFGEYFLQIIGKYQKEYRISCDKIVTERARFKVLLDDIEQLQVYPSQANYFLCKLQGNSAPELTEHLLDKYEIFIKDLTGKTGIPDDSFIRIAIRNKDDNDKLVICLKKIISSYHGRIYGEKSEINTESVKSFWNNNAKKDSSLKSVLLGYDFGENSANLHNQKEAKIVLDFIGNDKKTILDIGCGIGRWAYNLNNIIQKYDGIDFSDEFVQAANNNFKNYNEINFYCMSATDIDCTKLLKEYDVVIVTEVSMYINDDDLNKLYNYINIFTRKDSLLYIQDTTSLLDTRLTLKDFQSKELGTKYNAIYRTKTEYETLFKKYLPAFKLCKNGTELLLDKNSGAREETNARYWCLIKE